MIARLSIFFITTIFIACCAFGQDYHLVYLRDKGVTDTVDITRFFSSKSIERRMQQGIGFDWSDYPVNTTYQSILSQFAPIPITLKWLNAAVVYANESEIKTIKQLPFVLKIEKLKTGGLQKKSKASKFLEEKVSDLYGAAENQIALLQGKSLHDSGYIGTGIDIAIFDNGFPQSDSIRFFEKARKEGRLVPVANLVKQNKELFKSGGHGTNVLSCIASNVPDTFVGTAPGSKYYLFITEDDASESKLEEVNWARAAEMADSMGIRIINSSLGYTEFDDKSTNYTYANLDGKTTIVSQAASKAAEKGILVCNSAGNEGNKAWRYISAPADARYILAVGAIDANGVTAGFSGHGPSSDGRIKPEIMSKGVSAMVVSVNGQVGTSNGTSFSSPILAGMAACLWQTQPLASCADVREAIIKSCDKTIFPDNDRGFGIPDFSRAKEILNQKVKNKIESILLFPVPCKEFVNIYADRSLYQSMQVQVYNESGVYVKEINLDFNKENTGYQAMWMGDLPAGTYFLKFIQPGNIFTKKIVKEL